jgi:2-beta-glucuronyltransferase
LSRKSTTTIYAIVSNKKNSRARVQPPANSSARSPPMTGASSLSRDCIRVVMLSNHYIGSPRKAGFHWIAVALGRMGTHVTFVTPLFSPLSYLRRDFRTRLIAREDRNRLRTLTTRLDSYVWYTLFHPVHMRMSILNALTYPLFASYAHLPLGRLKQPLAQATHIIFESNAALMLVPRIRRLNPAARLIYRASDELGVLGTHPVVLRAERRALPYLDMVSVPTVRMLKTLEGPRTVLHGHGVEKGLFDSPSPSPYPAGTRNAVFVGINDLDSNALHLLADLFPDWHFHALGPMPRADVPANVRYYGEAPFERTVAFIRHADIGLATRLAVPGAEVYSDSLKMVQYAYARLPVVAPSFLRNRFGNIVPYDVGDVVSMKSAFEAAVNFDRSQIRSDLVVSWDELAAALTQAF